MPGAVAPAPRDLGMQGWNARADSLQPAFRFLSRVKIAYLFSRYPAVSHTFCDTEMLAHERAGLELEIDVIRPPQSSFRHGHARELRAPIHYAPPPAVMRALEQKARREGRYPEALVRQHAARFGPEYKPAQRARNALYFASALERRGIDLLHVHFANRAAHTAVFIKAITGLPFSITAHGQDFMADLGHPGLLDEICGEAAFIVTVSDFSRELLEKVCPSAHGKIHRVHNGIDLGKFAASARSAPAKPRILSVGRLVPVKGHRHLIEACARLREAGADFECVIVGDGPERAALAGLIEERGLQGTVELAGSLPQEEVARALAECDVFALPSVVDAQGATDILPTVVLEAMGSERPVLASAVGGLAELVEEGRTGLLVPPADETALANALGSLLADAERRAGMGRAGRAKAETEFNVGASAAALRDLFAKHARPAKPAHVTARKPPGTFAYLIGSWRGTSNALREEVLAIRAEHPEARVIIAKVPACYVVDRVDEPIFELADFLPDGMVLEGEWQEQRALAREVELWRNLLAIDGDEYLTQARWALHLRKVLTQAGVRHLHVAGAEALPCAWILRRLCGVTLSATIEAKTDRPLAQLQQLTADCLIVRTDHPELLLLKDPRYAPDFMEQRRLFFPRRNGAESKLRKWAARLAAFSPTGGPQSTPAS